MAIANRICFIAATVLENYLGISNTPPLFSAPRGPSSPARASGRACGPRCRGDCAPFLIVAREVAPAATAGVCVAASP